MTNTSTHSNPILEAHDLMMQEVQGYLSPAKPSAHMIHEAVCKAFHRRNCQPAAVGRTGLVPPSWETVRRAIRSLDPYEVERARNGAAAADKKFRPTAKGHRSQHHLERVEIDQWQADLAALFSPDARRGGKTQDAQSTRLIVHMEVCCKTRMPLSFKVEKAA